MAQRYAIDPRRVYVFGSDLEFAAQRASLNYAEVFSGGFWLGYHIYRPVKTGQGTMWSPKLPKPDPKSLALAKTHPFVLASLQESEQWVRWPTAFKGDGFKFIKTMTITTKQYHYPDFATDWLPDVLKHLDETTAKLKLPATKPGAAATTKPKAP